MLFVSPTGKTDAMLWLMSMSISTNACIDIPLVEQL